MTNPDRTEPDLLDIPLSRRDALDILHALSTPRDQAREQSGAISPGQSVLALHCNALEQLFRSKWTKPPQPEKG